jgi:hypothetical protein
MLTNTMYEVDWFVRTWHIQTTCNVLKSYVTLGVWNKVLSANIHNNIKWCLLWLLLEEHIKSIMDVLHMPRF